MFGFTRRETVRIRRKPALDLVARHRTVARVMIRVGLRDFRFRLCDSARRFRFAEQRKFLFRAINQITIFST